MIKLVYGIEKRDAEHVISNMWQRGKNELHRLGYVTKENLAEAIEKGDPRLSSTVFIDGVPCVIMGAIPYEGDHYTWFLATDDMLARGSALTKLISDTAKRWIVDFGVRTLYIISHSDHPKAPRWFKTLGFEPYGAREGSKHQYVYTRQLKRRQP